MEAATREGVLEAIEEMDSGAVKEYISFAYDVDNDELLKTQRTIAEITALAQTE